MDTMATHGTVQSSRDRVNVMLPGHGGDGMGNHFFAPAHGDVTEYVRQCITDAVAEQGTRVGGWAKRPHRITIRPEVGRGAYHFTVWTD